MLCAIMAFFASSLGASATHPGVSVEPGLIALTRIN
jgi:hypothetical protein